MNACNTHDPATFTNDGVGARNFCPTCRNRVCLRCAIAPAVLSWMSGYCDGCSRLNMQEERRRKAEYARQEEQRRLAEAWDAGRSSAHAALNPYREVTA